MGIKHKKLIAVLAAAVIVLAGLMLYVYKINVTDFEAKPLTVTLQGDRVSAEFEGTARELMHRENGEEWQILQGKLSIDGNEYPIDMKLSMTYSGLQNTYLYNEDGSYYATAGVAPDMKSLTLYFVSDEEADIHSAEKTVELKS